MSKQEETVPPSYNESLDCTASPLPPVLQQPQPQFIVQPVVVNQPGLVVVHPLKDAPSFESYTEVCPYCNISVATDVRYVPGSCFWIYLVVGLLLCWCFICCLCCDQSKDAHHYCPNCKREISVKIR